MNKEEIVNNPDYKATKAALEWWYSLPKEQRKATDIDAEPDIIDAYAEGVIHGWNNPDWTSVEERKPKEEGQVVLIYSKSGDVCVTFYKNGAFNCSPLLHAINVTHWMPIVPPRKEE